MGKARSLLLGTAQIEDSDLEKVGSCDGEKWTDWKEIWEVKTDRTWNFLGIGGREGEIVFRSQ